MPALVTPFTKSDEVDTNGSRWLCRNAIDGGVHAVVCAGSLGEFPCLTDEERRAVIKAVVDEANGKVPVIAGVGSGSTKISVMIAKEAADIGVDAIEALPPYYFNIGDDAVYAHYEKLASSVNVPVIIYNFPGTTKVNMSPALIARLADVPNIVGIKNSVDSFLHLRRDHKEHAKLEEAIHRAGGNRGLPHPRDVAWNKGDGLRVQQFHSEDTRTDLQLLRKRKGERSFGHLQQDNNSAERDGSAS